MTSGSDTGLDAKCHRLDAIYKALLAPTTFYILISWLFLTYMWNLFHEHTELWPLATPFEEEYLGYPLTILTYEAGPLGISIVLFLVFLFVKGGWGLAGRFFAFWFLLFVLLLTTGTFIQAMFPFVLIPRAPSPVSDWMILGVIIFLSAVLSGFLVWKAK